jgi:exodeoxyribonuclease VII large subunit
MKRQILSVTQITKALKKHVEDSFYDLWVNGEISNLNINKNGHCFFSLKDEGAVISSVIWRNSFSKINYNLENGLKILAHGNLSLYEKGGNYNLVIDYIEPEGLGDLMRKFLQLKDELKNKGYFDPSFKKQIPPFPDTIGVVTSPTGAALKDILNVLKRRFSNVNINIFPAKVQGEGAAEEIASMIKIANALNNIDVLIIGRGGGSYEDLWAFNEEIVADAIYNSQIPIISAVGHEVDFTIADYVADLRAPTPSAAAEIVVESKDDLKNTISSYTTRLSALLFGVVNHRKEKLNRFSSDEIAKRLKSVVERCKFTLSDLDRKASASLESVFIKRKNDFVLLTQKLEVLNPLSILHRGYSVAYNAHNEKIIKSSSDVEKGEKIKLRLYKGSLVCLVEGKND